MEEEKKYKDIELRSEEVQEVMNHISPWVVRCGITVLALILLMILVGCWIFRYPDTLAAEVTLATEEPPAFVLSHATGKLDTLYVKNGSLVSTDADLGVIGNAASSEDVRFLKERMKAWEAQDYDWREGVEFFCRQALAVGGNCNRLLQLSLLHLQNMHVLWSWTITLGNFVFRKNNWVDNAPIFGWQSGNMS